MHSFNQSIPLDNHLDIPKGFAFLGKSVGIKASGNKDFALLMAESPCPASAVFTRNLFCGENIPYGRKAVENCTLQAILVTSGIANVATGEQGSVAVAREIEAVADELGVAKDDVLISSTGKIGPQLPLSKVLAGIKGSKSELDASQSSARAFSEAIMTTDLKAKARSVQIAGKNGEPITILGIAKGSGMIEPNMATMLVYFATDAEISKDKVHQVLTNAVAQSFNVISVDTDTSTSDTVALIASGNAGAVNEQEFQVALNALALDLAKDVIRDGEGSTKLIEAHVKGAKTEADAKLFAKCIVNSPLIKTAVYGKDPNWGRVVMALGKAFDANFAKDKLSISFGEYEIFKNNQEISENIAPIHEYLANDEITITVNIGLGTADTKAYGCDLTEGYIDINAHYST